MLFRSPKRKPDKVSVILVGMATSFEGWGVFLRTVEKRGDEAQLY